MKTSIYLFLILIPFLSFGQTNDIEEIKKVIIAFQEDFNEGIFKNVKNYTTEDWIHINPGGGMTNGRTAVLKEVVAVHQTFLKGVSMTIDSLNIKLSSPQFAYAIVYHKLSDYELPKGTINKNQQNIKTYIFEKRKKKWLMILDQNTVVQKP